jgi:hypothetical protein
VRDALLLAAHLVLMDAPDPAVRTLVIDVHFVLAVRCIHALHENRAGRCNQNECDERHERSPPFPPAVSCLARAVFIDARVAKKICDLCIAIDFSSESAAGSKNFSRKT